MALLQRNAIKAHQLLSAVGVRSFSVVSSKTFSEKDVKKSVFISQSSDVFTNLALENWIFKNFDLTNHHVLLLSKNDPCVVIGNKQNPWIETNVTTLNHNQPKENHINLARRENSGRAIYNDQGNLNLTFFSPTPKHNTLYNMEILSRALFRQYTMKTNLSRKEELTVYNKSMTVTGSQLGEENAYHHCSLLVDVNKGDLANTLIKEEGDPNTTSSVQAKISAFMNVREVVPKAKIDELTAAVGWEFMRTHAYTLKDGGKELASQQKGFQMINPTEKWFPGITEIRSKLAKWDWCYGETPNFSISRTFPVPNNLLNNYEGASPDLCITLKVESGRIKDVTLFVPPGLTSSGFSGEAKVVTSLKGRKFSEDAMNSLEYYFGIGENTHLDDKEKFVTDCVRQVMSCA